MDKFASILDRPASEITAPKSIPPGTYLGMVKGLPRYDKSTKKGTEYVEFMIGMVSAQDDVDQDDLKLALTNEKTGEVKPLTDVQMKTTYYITESAAWRYKKFLQDCGFDDQQFEEHSMRELGESLANTEVMVLIRHKSSDDGKRIFAEISDTARAG